jgi:hypothetical protein
MIFLLSTRNIGNHYFLNKTTAFYMLFFIIYKLFAKTQRETPARDPFAKTTRETPAREPCAKPLRETMRENQPRKPTRENPARDP